MAASVSEISDMFARASLSMAAAEIKALTKEEMIDSYILAIGIHLKRAERLITLASRLNASSRLPRRAIAITAINQASKRVIAAETCDVLLRAVDATKGALPWSDDPYSPNIKDKIAIIQGFLNAPPARKPRARDMDDEIPF
jgi:hypothetical protein